MAGTEIGRLTAAALLVTEFTGFPTRVENIYRDYGAGIRWNTLVTYRHDPALDEFYESNGVLDSYQMLYPKHHDKLVNGSYEEFMSTVKELCENHLFAKNERKVNS